MIQIPSFDETVAAAREQAGRVDVEGLSAAGIYRRPFEYYLMGTYPPIKAMHPVTPAEVFAGATENFNLYVHIPFCEQYCTFCHFTKEINPRADRVEQYLGALLKEIELAHRQLDGRITAHTLYFGGGTPSYLNPRQFEALFAQIKKHVRFTDQTEISFELHPGLIRQPDYEDRIRAIKAFGNNRWVFGVQSMDDVVLKKLNRGHTRQEVFDLLEILQRHGGDRNLSLDLIYGLPYQTLENWYETLTTLLRAGIEKFNIFPLMFKVSDPISLHYVKEPHIFPDGWTRMVMHYMAEYVLGTQGFHRGPVLYYAKSQKHSGQQESKFDKITDINLLPFGVSGFGYIGHTQYFNVCDVDEYMRTVGAGRLPVWRGYTLPRHEQMRRIVMFALRSRGVSRGEFAARFGVDPVEHFADTFDVLRRFGLIEETAEHVHLNDEGSLHADGIGSLFASSEVTQMILETNSAISNPRRDLIEIHDFSPIGRMPSPPVNILPRSRVVPPQPAAVAQSAEASSGD